MTDSDRRDDMTDAFADDERFASMLPLLVHREVAFSQRHEAVRAERTTSLGQLLELGKAAERTRTCSTTRSTIVNGTGRTDGKGTRRIDLNEWFPCDRGDVPREHLSFTATAVSTSPALLTTRLEVEDLGPGYGLWLDEDGKPSAAAPQGKQVAIDVLSWDASGAAAGLVDFHWICVVQTAVHFHPGG